MPEVPGRSPHPFVAEFAGALSCQPAEHAEQHSDEHPAVQEPVVGADLAAGFGVAERGKEHAGNGVLAAGKTGSQAAQSIDQIKHFEDHGK